MLGKSIIYPLLSLTLLFLSSSLLLAAGPRAKTIPCGTDTTLVYCAVRTGVSITQPFCGYVCRKKCLPDPFGICRDFGAPQQRVSPKKRSQ